MVELLSEVNWHILCITDQWLAKCRLFRVQTTVIRILQILRDLHFSNSQRSEKQWVALHASWQMQRCTSNYRDREVTSFSTTPSVEESTLAHCSTAGACFRVITLISPSKCSVSWSALSTSAVYNPHTLLWLFLLRQNGTVSFLNLQGNMHLQGRSNYLVLKTDACQFLYFNSRK